MKKILIVAAILGAFALGQSRYTIKATHAGDTALVITCFYGTKMSTKPYDNVLIVSCEQIKEKKE